MRAAASRLRRRQPRPPAAPVPPPTPDPVKETLAFVRAQGSIRFIALPFFLGTIALLVKTYYEPGAIPQRFIAWAALGLCLVALTVEIVLSRNLIAWWGALQREPRLDPSWKLVSAHRHPGALHAVRWALLLPYVVTLSFWLHKSMRLAIPVAGGLSDTQHRNALAIASVLVAALACGVAHRTWRSAARQAP